jgi:hypothetical protein
MEEYVKIKLEKYEKFKKLEKDNGKLKRSKVFYARHMGPYTDYLEPYEGKDAAIRKLNSAINERDIANRKLEIEVKGLRDTIQALKDRSLIQRILNK